MALSRQRKTRHLKEAITLTVMRHLYTRACEYTALNLSNARRKRCLRTHQHRRRALKHLALFPIKAGSIGAGIEPARLPRRCA